ncbi:MAG: arsenic transporter, partial [Candidatus Dormibacteria bacterium]
MIPEIPLLVLFAATAVGVTTRPFGLWEGWWPLGGAALAVLARLVDPGQALAGVRSSLDVLAFFLGLLLLANCLHRQGALT